MSKPILKRTFYREVFDIDVLKIFFTKRTRPYEINVCTYHLNAYTKKSLVVNVQFVGGEM